MFAVSLAGTAGYALFIRALLFKSIAHKISINSDLFSSKFAISAITPDCFCIGFQLFHFFCYTCHSNIQ